jgi:hypothetical protein
LVALEVQKVGRKAE